MARRRAPIAVALALAAAAGVGWLVFRRVHAPNADALTLYGNVDIREVDVGFRVQGRLVQVAVDEGDRVGRGERLAHLDDEPYREARAVADARVQRATAQLDELLAGTRPEEVQRARARVRQALASFEDAERDLVRQRRLSPPLATTQDALDAAVARRDEAAAALSSARSALALAIEGPRREDIDAARAELAAAIAERDEAETRVADTVLDAPNDATVLTRIREPGSIVGAGEPVYTLSLRDPVYVRAYVSEPDLGKLSPGARVTVTTDSSKKAYHGTIGFISPRAEFTPKSVETTELRTDLVYRLRIIVRDADEGLRQGMPVTVKLPLAPEDSAAKRGGG